MQYSEASMITPTAVYVKQLAEHDLKPKKQKRIVRNEIAVIDLNPIMRARGRNIARRCRKGSRVHVPAMCVSDLGHVLRALELKRACI